MTAQLYCDIRNKIYNQNHDALVTIHTCSKACISANIKDIAYMGTYIIVDTFDDAGTCYIPIESIEFFQV